MKKFICSLLCLLMICVGFTACGNNDTNTDKPSDVISGLHHVEMVIKDYGTVKLELNADEAPITVENFINLASEGFYNGVPFHRLDKDFVLQSGDPDGDGYSNNDRPNIKGEFNANGVINRIKHERGVISMARSSNPDSASTQFFIVHQTSVINSESLNGQYAAFGKLLAGYGTLDKIASVKTGKNDKPKSKQQMAEVRFVNIVSTPTTPDTE